MKLPLAIVLSLATLAAAEPARADTTAELQAAFHARTGARLVFRARDLPAGVYYDVMRELPAARRAKAARIALAEADKYPRGYLGDMGLDAIGIFDGLASKRGDGYRAYDRKLGGYRYFGLWNGDDAIVAAYYSDGQLPLTLHHEIYHHVDATRAGTTRYARYFHADDDRFASAHAGKKRYPALRLSAADRRALGRRATGTLLRTTVSGYASKSAGEDQAETARYLMTSLPDAILQMADRPALAGSQRMLHVLAQYRRAAASGPDARWLIDVALGRAHGVARTRAAAATAERHIRARLAPRRGDTVFNVWGFEDARGVNPVLRADVARMGERVSSVAAAGRGVAGAEPVVTATAARSLRLLARYRSYIDRRWSITPGTDAAFDRARDRMIAAVADRAVRARLRGAGWSFLAQSIDARGAVADPRPDNRYARKVDAAIADPAIRRAIRRVQPAAIRFSNGSGVNLTADGVVLTAGHVAPSVGSRRTVELPDGRRFTARTFAHSARLDISLLRIENPPADLPVAPFAPAAPKVGATAICIGQPGRTTPGGEPTGYQPFHVSVGRIRGFLPDRLGAQSLGRTKHDAWTYWGHSGGPIFDARGRIIAMHNSWDSRTAMRHAVTWEALVSFLRKHRIPFDS